MAAKYNAFSAWTLPIQPPSFHNALFPLVICQFSKRNRGQITVHPDPMNLRSTSFFDSGWRLQAKQRQKGWSVAGAMCMALPLLEAQEIVELSNRKVDTPWMPSQGFPPQVDAGKIVFQPRRPLVSFPANEASGYDPLYNFGQERCCAHKHAQASLECQKIPCSGRMFVEKHGAWIE